ALSGVELADELEEAGGRGVEVGRQLGDLVTQAVERARVHGESPFCWGDSTPVSGLLRQGGRAGEPIELRPLMVNGCIGFPARPSYLDSSGKGVARGSQSSCDL